MLDKADTSGKDFNFKYQFEHISEEGFKKKYKIKLDPSELQNTIEKKLNEIASKAKIPGFRPGKVPPKMISEQYHAAVHQEEAPKIIQNSLDKFFSDNKIEIIGSPEIDDLVTSQDDFSFSVTFYEKPNIKEPEYQSISLDKYIGDVEEKYIEENLQLLAEKNKKYSNKTGKSENGDIVTIDFLGTIDGKAFDGGKAENFDLILGSKSFIDNFEDQLMGKESGDDVTVQVRFPENYGHKNLSGKQAQFQVKIHGIKSPEEISIDDDLAIRIGLSSLEELKTKISEELDKNMQEISHAYLKKELFDKLETLYQIELPQNMIDQEFRFLWQQVFNTKFDDLKSEHVHDENCNHDEDSLEEIPNDEEKTQELKEYYTKIACRRLKLGIVLAEIGRIHNIQITSEEVRQSVFTQAQQYPGQENAILNHFRDNPQALEQLKSSILEEKVTDFIIESVNITEKKVGTDKLLDLAKELK